MKQTEAIGLPSLASSAAPPHHSLFRAASLLCAHVRRIYKALGLHHGRRIGPGTGCVRGPGVAIVAMVCIGAVSSEAFRMAVTVPLELTRPPTFAVKGRSHRRLL